MSTHPVANKKPARAKAALPYWINEFDLIRTAVLTAVAAVTIGMTCVLVLSLIHI